MNSYVALLRGINVGGNNKISMAELRVCFGKLGFENVSTYINSGNIIFSDSNHTEQKLVNIIERSIKDRFGLDIPVVVRSSKQINQVVSKIPPDWVTDKSMRTDVIFLWQEVDRPLVLNEIATNPEVDNLIYTPGAVVWNFNRIHYDESKMHKFIGTKVYKLMTARNSTTVRKLQSLMNAP